MNDPYNIFLLILGLAGGVILASVVIGVWYRLRTARETHGGQVVLPAALLSEPPKPLDGPERRVEPRAPLLLRVAIDGDEARYTQDLSPSGCCVLGPNSFSAGDEISIALDFPGLLYPIDLRATVRWARTSAVTDSLGGQPSFGLRWLDSDEVAAAKPKIAALLAAHLPDEPQEAHVVCLDPRPEVEAALRDAVNNAVPGDRTVSQYLVSELVKLGEEQPSTAVGEVLEKGLWQLRASEAVQVRLSVPRLEELTSAATPADPIDLLVVGPPTDSGEDRFALLRQRADAVIGASVFVRLDLASAPTPPPGIDLTVNNLLEIKNMVHTMRTILCAKEPPEVAP